MGRLKLSIQGREVYRTTLEVRVNDVNYAGHLGHDSVLTLCHEARIRFLRAIEQSELDLYGSGIIMTDAMASYLGEGALGDTIEITLFLADVSTFGFDMYYAMKTAEREIAVVKTGLAFFDYGLRKIVPCPGEFVAHYA